MPRRPRRACIDARRGSRPATAGPGPGEPPSPASDRSPGPEVVDVEDRAGPLADRLPYGLDVHADAYVVGVDLAEQMQEAAVGAVDGHHSGDLGRLERLHVPGHVTDGIRLHRPCVLDLDPAIGLPEASLAEHARRNQDPLTSPTLASQDLPGTKPVQESPHG